MSAERYKMRPIISLQMRQLTPVKSLAHFVYPTCKVWGPEKCGDSRPRLSVAEPSSAIAVEFKPGTLESLTNNAPVMAASCKSGIALAENWRASSQDSRGRLSAHYSVPAASPATIAPPRLGATRTLFVGEFSTALQEACECAVSSSLSLKAARHGAARFFANNGRNGVP